MSQISIKINISGTQYLVKDKTRTSATEIDEPPMEDTVLPYLLGIDCDIGKGEYGSSDSLTG